MQGVTNSCRCPFSRYASSPQLPVKHRSARCGAVTPRCGHVSGPRQDTAADSELRSRRYCLLSLSTFGLAMAAATARQSATAAESFEALLPKTDRSNQVDTLPKGYKDLSSRLVKALREAIETDISPTSEGEMRKKADSAKELVREWMINWRDNALVSSTDSYSEISGTIRDLGTFYTRKGQRARMSQSDADPILRRLDAAAVSLPP